MAGQFELTEEQAAKLNAAMSGEQVELTEEEANIMNQAMAPQASSQPSQPAPRPVQNQMEMRAATPEEKSFGQGSFMRSANSAVMGVTGGLAAPVMDAAQRASNWFTNKDPEQAVAEPLPSDAYRKAQQDAPVSNIAGAFAQPQVSGPKLGMAVLGGLQGATTADSMGQDPVLGAGIGAVSPGVAQGAGKLIGGAAGLIDDIIVQKLGPTALKFVNDFTQRVATQGTNVKAQSIQNLSRLPSNLGLGSKYDDIKAFVLNKLSPGTLQSAPSVRDRLAKMVSSADPERASYEQLLQNRNNIIKQNEQASSSIAKQAAMARNTNRNEIDYWKQANSSIGDYNQKLLSETNSQNLADEIKWKQQADRVAQQNKMGASSREQQIAQAQAENMSRKMEVDDINLAEDENKRLATEAIQKQIQFYVEHEKQIPGAKQKIAQLNAAMSEVQGVPSRRARYQKVPEPYAPQPIPDEPAWVVPDEMPPLPKPQLQEIPQASQIPVPDLPADPRVNSSAYQTASWAQKLMAPGLVSRTASAPNRGMSNGIMGPLINNMQQGVLKTTSIAGMKTSKFIADKAIARMNKRLSSVDQINPDLAPFQQEQIKQKLMQISQMEPTKANAYAYAESMVNPVFRQIWLNAQREQEPK